MSSNHICFATFCVETRPFQHIWALVSPLSLDNTSDRMAWRSSHREIPFRKKAASKHLTHSSPLLKIHQFFWHQSHSMGYPSLLSCGRSRCRIYCYEGYHLQNLGRLVESKQTWKTRCFVWCLQQRYWSKILQGIGNSSCSWERPS